MSNVIEGYFGPAKKQRMNAISYVRDFAKTKGLIYEQKFATLFTICDDAASGRFEAVIVAYPETLGDNYEELMMSLSLLAKAGLLVIVASESPAVSI